MIRPFTHRELEAWHLLIYGNLTQRQIAQKLGVSESAISQRLHRLARRHNLPISKLTPPPRRRTHFHSPATTMSNPPHSDHPFSYSFSFS